MKLSSIEKIFFNFDFGQTLGMTLCALGLCIVDVVGIYLIIVCGLGGSLAFSIDSVKKFRLCFELSLFFVVQTMVLLIAVGFLSSFYKVAAGISVELLLLFTLIQGRRRQPSRAD